MKYHVSWYLCLTKYFQIDMEYSAGKPTIIIYIITIRDYICSELALTKDAI